MIAPCCWRSRIAVVRCSFAHWLAAGRRCTSRKTRGCRSVGLSRPQWERAALDQGLIAVNSILRDWVKGQISAIETGILRGCNRPTYCFPFGQHHHEGRAGLAPLPLALSAHRRAGRVLRLQPRLRRPAGPHVRPTIACRPSRPNANTCNHCSRSARAWGRTTTFRRVRDDRTYKQDWLEFRV